MKGEIHYPLLNKKKKVEFGSNEKEQLEEVIKDIEEVVTGDMPKPKRKGICKKCAYEEFCFSDNV